VVGGGKLLEYLRMPTTWLCLTALAAAAGRAHAADQPPNILWFMSDDLGYGELSSFGQKSFSTPRIDKLAAEGTRFTDAYAGAPVCAPSRGVFMTGLHTGHAYVRGEKPRL